MRIIQEKAKIMAITRSREKIQKYSLRRQEIEQVEDGEPRRHQLWVKLYEGIPKHLHKQNRSIQLNKNKKT